MIPHVSPVSPPNGLFVSCRPLAPSLVQSRHPLRSYRPRHVARVRASLQSAVPRRFPLDPHHITSPRRSASPRRTASHDHSIPPGHCGRVARSTRTSFNSTAPNTLGHDAQHPAVPLGARSPRFPHSPPATLPPPVLVHGAPRQRSRATNSRPRVRTQKSCITNSPHIAAVKLAPSAAQDLPPPRRHCGHPRLRAVPRAAISTDPPIQRHPHSPITAEYAAVSHFPPPRLRRTQRPRLTHSPVLVHGTPRPRSRATKSRPRACTQQSGISTAARITPTQLAPTTAPDRSPPRRHGRRSVLLHGAVSGRLDRPADLGSPRLGHHWRACSRVARRRSPPFPHSPRATHPPARPRPRQFASAIPRHKVTPARPHAATSHHRITAHHRTSATTFCRPHAIAASPTPPPLRASPWCRERPSRPTRRSGIAHTPTSLPSMPPRCAPPARLVSAPYQPQLSCRPSSSMENRGHDPAPQNRARAPARINPASPHIRASQPPNSRHSPLPRDRRPGRLGRRSVPRRRAARTHLHRPADPASHTLGRSWRARSRVARRRSPRFPRAATATLPRARPRPRRTASMIPRRKITPTRPRAPILHQHTPAHHHSPTRANHLSRPHAASPTRPPLAASPPCRQRSHPTDPPIQRRADSPTTAEHAAVSRAAAVRVSGSRRPRLSAAPVLVHGAPRP